MFKNKNQVDLHVQNIFKRCNNDTERNMRCYHFAKLYKEVGDYESARRFIVRYLTAREDSADAHKLYGHILLGLKQKKKALAEFKCSLELDRYQYELLPKVCHILAELDEPLDLDRAQYWVDRTKPHFPNNSSVFRLRERIISEREKQNKTNSSYQGVDELEALIAAELAVRPGDVPLRVRLLQLYLRANRVNDAYSHATLTEAKGAFRNDLQWYECLADVFEKASHEKKNDWEFVAGNLNVLERLSALSLEEYRVVDSGITRRSNVDCAKILQNFDKALHSASQLEFSSSEREFFHEFLKHMRGQLVLHLATLIFRKVKEPSSWRKASKAAGALLLLAVGFGGDAPPDPQPPWAIRLSDVRRKEVARWAVETSFRVSQAGHILLGLSRDRGLHFMEQIGQFCTGAWREQVYQIAMGTLYEKEGEKDSHFLQFQNFAHPTFEIPSITDILPHDEMAQKLHPGSLHHMVWLGLEIAHCVAPVNKRIFQIPPDFSCIVFEGLSLGNNLGGGPESISQLDVDAFLYATIYSSASVQEEWSNGTKIDQQLPSCLPAALTDPLCSPAQAQWWSTAYQLLTGQLLSKSERKDDSKTDVGERRLTLQRGLEVIRAVGNHGLGPELSVKLARTFVKRAKILSTSSTTSTNEVRALEERANLYWAAALPILERMARSQAVHYPQKRLFEYRGKPLSNAEVVSLLDEAHLAMAVKMMMEGKDEEAINAFLLLKVPEASYYLALIYKKLAAQEANGQAMDEITPETKSRQIALYTKAKECLHLTQERLRSTEYDRSHPIAIGVGKELEDLEIKFDKLNDSTWVDPEQTVISSLLAEDILEESQKEKSWSLRKNWPSSAGNGVLNDNRMHSTPVRNTPSRMGNGIPARNVSIEESHQSFNETVKMLKDLKLWLADEMNSMKTGMSEIKDQVVAVKEDLAKLKTSRHQAHHTSEIPRQATEGRDAEEDIYVYGDEDEYGEGEEVNIAAAAAASAAAAAAAAAVAAQTQGDKYGTYPGSGYPYQGYPTYRQMSGVQGAATVTYGAPSAPAQAPPPAALLPPSIAPFFPLAGGPVDPSLIPPNAAGMYHSSLRYYGQGALPFSEGQQLPDFRGDARNLSGVPLRPPLIPPGMGVHPDVDRGTPPYHSLGSDPSYMMDKHMTGPPPTLPENVVITSSDTLPTSVPSNQPPLSVVIPPRHRLGTPASPAQPAKLSSDAMTSTTSVVTTSTAIPTAPHAFQISMPPQAQIPTQPPLDKSVSAIPPVETDKLLSSVPSPVHSAVSGDKTTPKASRTSTSPKTRTPRKSLGEEDDEAGEADDSIEHDPCPDFQPVIPLPAVVETHTGEEEETLLFSSRCKLYRFMEREWKERGIGIIKILHNQTTGKARIIMRREQVFKVCANHFVTPDMSLSSVAGAKGLAWLWVANDFADEEVKLEKLSARFKTSVEAEGFKEAFEKAKKIVAEAKPDKTSSEGEKGDKEKVIGVGVPTSDSQKITSSGVGSQKVTSSTVEPATKTPLRVKEASNISTPAEKQKVVLEGFTFVSPPTLKQVDDDKKKEEEKKNAAKPNIFASFSFGQTPAPPTGGITWGKPTLGISSTLDSSAKESSKPAKTGDQPEKSLDSEKKDMAAFKIDSTPKATETPNKPTFGSPLSSSKGEGDGEDGEFMPTAEFKPVIPLPQLVEVKTGEEGEEVLFEHRAKLLRFANKEWIEFGIGQMKITLNPSTGKVRLIMRREQVLKVCCNHFLTEDMQFMSLKTSDRCWTWHAQDYADGTLTPKTLAIKFKGADEAARFKQVIDDLQKDMVDGKAKLDKTAKDKVPESSDNSGPCKGNVEKLSDLFKPEAGSWECKECYIRNKGDTKSCVACSTVRPGFVDNSAKEDEKSSFSPFKFGITPQATPSTQVQTPTPAFSIGAQPTFAPSQTVGFKFGSSSTTDSPKPSSFVASAETPKAAAPQTKKTEGMPYFSSLFKLEEGWWECSSCYVRNKKDDTKCKCCHAQKPGTVATADVPKSQAPQTTFTFGIPSSKSDSKTDSVDALKSQAPQATFTFGIPTSTSDSKKVEPSDSQKGPVPQATFSFGIPTLTSDSKKTDSVKDAIVISKLNECFGSLAAAFKPGEGSWECKSCYVRNEKDVLKCRACGELKPGQSAVTQPEEGSWECKSCYVRNKKDVLKCIACGELKPGQSAVTTATTSQTGAPPAFRFGVQPDTSAESKPAAATTAFTFCTSTVPTVGKSAGDSWAPSKFTFGASQPSTGATVSSATPLFGQPLTSFTFGATTTGSKPTEEKKVADPVTGFTFNSNQKYEFHFKGVDPKINALGSSPSSKGSYFKSPDRQISHDESGGSDLYQEEDDGDHIHFQPVIPLPDKVPLHTGEENEEVLYQHRAKLYRWNDKEWKERGCGDIKLLKHLEDGRVRMLMRREQVLKICLNHYITEELSLTPKGDRAWQWTAVDFSEGEGTPELFSVRFKSAEIAESFREAFDEAKAGLGKPREKREGGEKTPTPKTPTNTPQVGYPINKSPAMQAFSFKLGSEATPPSTTASRFSLEGLFGSASSTPKTPASETKSTGSTPKSEASSEVEVVFERKTSEEDRQAALKLMLPPNFFAYRDKPPCPGCMGCENYDQEKLDRFFARNVKSTSKVEKDGKEDSEGKNKEESTSSTTVTSTTTSDSSASVVQKSEQPQEEKTDYGLPFLKVESNLSFASIAAASSSQSGFGPVPKTTSMVWGGVITPVFGSASKTTGAAGEGRDSDGEGDEEGAVETHDPHYEPIVPLPALINVRTGEEEETKVFGDRSKLYRFDSNTKEWKERGVGELKILFHPVNHTYRFLMRRELVHKLVLNHQITADFDLKEMKNSDKSYIWYATNYAEDAPELEQLCAKFKNQDLAKQFAEVVRRCVDDIAAYQASKSLQDISGQECDVSQSTRQYEGDEEDEEYDEEGEDDDDEYEEVDDEELERRTIFEKRGRMDVREGDEWKILGTGDIKVIYEPEFLGTILTLEVNGLVKCNALITNRSSIKAKEKSCECFADDLSQEETMTRKYRVKLSSNLSALEFESAFKQGVSIALDPQIEDDHQ